MNAHLHEARAIISILLESGDGNMALKMKDYNQHTPLDSFLLNSKHLNLSESLIAETLKWISELSSQLKQKEVKKNLSEMDEIMNIASDIAKLNSHESAKLSAVQQQQKKDFEAFYLKLVKNEKKSKKLAKRQDHEQDETFQSNLVDEFLIQVSKHSASLSKEQQAQLEALRLKLEEKSKRRKNKKNEDISMSTELLNMVAGTAERSDIEELDLLTAARDDQAKSLFESFSQNMGDSFSEKSPDALESLVREVVDQPDISKKLIEAVSQDDQEVQSAVLLRLLSDEAQRKIETAVRDIDILPIDEKQAIVKQLDVDILGRLKNLSQEKAARILICELARGQADNDFLKKYLHGKERKRANGVIMTPDEERKLKEMATRQKILEANLAIYSNLLDHLLNSQESVSSTILSCF